MANIHTRLASKTHLMHSNLKVVVKCLFPGVLKNDFFFLLDVDLGLSAPPSLFLSTNQTVNRPAKIGHAILGAWR